MSDTKIEWASKVWNPVVGCTVHSPGCTNCYAMRMAARLEAMAPRPDGTGNIGLAHYLGTTQSSRAGAVWTGKIGIAPDDAFTAPLRRKKPTDYFVNSMSDLFHKDVPDEVIDRVFAVMALAPQHTFKVLTKRSARMREYMTSIDNGDGERIEGLRSALVEGMAQSIWHERTGDDTVSEWLAVHLPLPNVMLGVSVEDQTRADERIPDLLATPAAVRFISAEPLLGPVDLRQWAHDYGCSACGYGGPVHERCRECGWHGSNSHQAGPCPECREQLQDDYACPACGEPDGEGDFGPTVSSHRLGLIDWVIAGGESGPNARGSDAEVEANMRSLRDQCASAGVAFFGKQGFKKHPLPDDLLVREFPA